MREIEVREGEGYMREGDSLNRGICEGEGLVRERDS